MNEAHRSRRVAAPPRRASRSLGATQRLSAALLSVALPSFAAGCDVDCTQSDLKDVSPGISEALLGVDSVDLPRGGHRPGALLIAGEAGVIVSAIVGHEPLRVTRIGAGDLHAALLGPNQRGYVAGVGGVMFGADLVDGTWTPISTGTVNDLHALAWIEVRDPAFGTWRASQLAVGDEVVLLRDPVDDSWDVVPPPPDGWGRLRVAVGGDQVHVAGLGGVIWSAEDPRGAWTRADSGTTEDLLAGDLGWSAPILVGRRGTVLERREGRWELVPTTLEVDLVAVDGFTALAADGRVFDLLLVDEPQEEPWTAPGARSLDAKGEILLVGDAGSIRRIPLSCD